MESEQTMAMLTKEDLVNFEKEIAEVFATGIIRAPVHLRAGREDQLIKIFQEEQIGEDDYRYFFKPWMLKLTDKKYRF
ncbi:MAG: hypothetical protein NUV91_00710, partial [Candidatus Omnitrophica bacterium]|nr:hypothetical protein [Candidatus Omnitrophota bacterium]